MSSSFYTNAVQWGNKILFRGVSDGQRIESKDDFRPTLFVKSPVKSGYQTLFGESLKPIHFEDINAAKVFVKTYEDVGDFSIYGNTWFQYQYIAERYEDAIEYDPSLIHVASLDIETEVENGFPNPQKAEERILIITVKNRTTKQIHSFAWHDFDTSKVEHFDASGYHYHKYRNEEEMLQGFLKFWEADHPDVITGWNIRYFDIPYLVNRIVKVLPERAELRLSPWKSVQEKMIMENNRDQQVFDLIGISTLDYLELYKKFNPSKKQESYKLDYIASVELGKNKLENPYETFKEFYTNNWHLFVEYNVVDTELIDEMEDKMGLIELVFMMAFRARCNFADVFSPVRMWDTIIYNELRKHNIAPPQPRKMPSESIVGAFVRNPPAGRYTHIMSVDATSLYPRIMLQYNMSPETLVEKQWIHGSSVGAFLNNDDQESLDDAKEQNVAVAVNGYAFLRTKQGFFPMLVESMFNERVATKKKQLTSERLYEKTHDITHKEDAKRFKLTQEALKIALNSLYGACANRYFRFYSTAIAEGITMTGQYIVQQVASDIDAYLNKVCGTTGKQYVFYIDTDSNYFTLSGMAQKYFPDTKGTELIDLMDAIYKEKIAPVIKKSCEHIAIQTNAYRNTTEFKREIIADQGIWTVKKRYALNVWDSEGVRFAEPKQKIVGMESNRSSTPRWVRDKFKQAVKVCLIGTESEIQAFLAQCRAEFNVLPPETIAFPKGVNGLRKYSDPTDIYSKGCPIHVRASLLYNGLLEDHKLLKKYETIKEGDKMKYIYLKSPNPLHENIVGWLGKMPLEFGLHPYIDYDLQYEKTLLAPIESVLEAIKWHSSPRASLLAFM